MASIAPDWLKTVVPTNWFDPYSRPFNEYRLPQKEAERLELGEQIGRDGIYLLTHVYAKTSQPELRLLIQVEVLHRVWIVQYYQDENDQTPWRRKGNLPPGEHILTSPYDTDARLSKKRESIRVGYKVHLTETHDDDKPHLITHVETTLATEPDSEVVEAIHAELGRKNCLPSQHLFDNGYASATIFATSRADYGIDLLARSRPDSSWQTQTEEAFDITCFQIDFENRSVTCPQGHDFTGSGSAGDAPYSLPGFGQSASPAFNHCRRHKLDAGSGRAQWQRAGDHPHLCLRLPCCRLI